MPIFSTNTSSIAYLEISNSLVVSASSIINFASASLVTGSFTGRGSGLTNVTASYIQVGSNTSASYALTASVLLGSVTSASYALSASYAPSSPSISASYAGTASVLLGAVTSASFSVSGSVAAYSTTASYLVGNLTGSNPPHRPGTVFYDTSSYALAYYNDNTQMMVNVGQESIIRVFNSASNVITNGAAVYISASFNGSPAAWLAIADGTQTKFNVAGIATTTISPFTYGYITLSGRVNGVSINLPTGSSLWLSTSSSGSYQTTMPALPFEQVFIGTLVASGSGASTILVNLTNHSFGAVSSSAASYATTASYVNNHRGYVWLPVQSAKLPGTSSARLDAGTRMWRLLFDPVSNQSASWQFVVPSDYASSPRMYMKYAVTTAQGVVVSASAWSFKTSAVGQGLTVETFTTNNTILTASVSSSQTANTMITTSLALTNSTNITASELLYVELERVAGNPIDSVSSNIAVYGLMFEYLTL